MRQITSLENPLVKMLKKLKEKKYRDKYHLFIVEGMRSCELAADSPLEIDTFILSESFLAQPQASVPFWEKFSNVMVPDKIFSVLSDTQTPQGILCLAKIPDPIPSFSGNRYLYLDNVRDPGNVGTIIRTADALGFCGVLLSENCADLYSPKVIRSTMGSIFSIATMERCPASILTEMKQHGFCIAASALDRNCTDLYRAVWGNKVVFVLGNEANGVSKEILSLADFTVRIPMYGKAESLNVSIAAALLMGEEARRNYEK